LIPVLGGYLFIFLARVIDVSLATMRMLLIVRGMGLYAAMVGFFEVMVYVTALSQVVGNLDKPINLLVYALGFATGNIVGSYLEEKLAIGLTTIQVITQDDELCEKIRSQGFGVTVLEGKGREGIRHVLLVSLTRKELPSLLEYIENQDAEAFLTVMDTKASKGGYFKQAQKEK